MVTLHNNHCLPLQVCSLPQDGSSFRKLVPQSEFDGVTEVLESLDQKATKAMEFIVLFENSFVVGNLVWALRW